MSSVIQSVEELIAESAPRDNQLNFSAMWEILSELRERIAQRFSLTLDPSVRDLATYGSADGSTQGHLAAYTGEAIDWMIHAYMGSPSLGFSNMHLTVWLGPEIDVPHFGMALGTIPDMFCYLDLVPRVDLNVDLAYLDRYYEGRNETYLAFEADPAFRPFTSRTLYMRQAQSRTSLCYMAEPTAANLEKFRQAAHAQLDQWLRWVDEATPVSPEKQEALAARDLFLRRSIAERDPANVMGVKIFGQELTDRLVGTLWGQNRQLQKQRSWQQ